MWRDIFYVARKATRRGKHAANAQEAAVQQRETGSEDFERVVPEQLRLPRGERDLLQHSRADEEHKRNRHEFKRFLFLLLLVVFLRKVERYLLYVQQLRIHLVPCHDLPELVEHFEARYDQCVVDYLQKLLVRGEFFWAHYARRVLEMEPDGTTSAI